MRRITTPEQLTEYINEQAKPPNEADKAKAEYYRAKADKERAQAEYYRQRTNTRPNAESLPQSKPQRANAIGRPFWLVYFFALLVILVEVILLFTIC